MMGVLKSLVYGIGAPYCRLICSLEHARSQARGTYNLNERSIEYRFVFDTLTRLAPGTILDVGTGQSALPALMKLAGFLVTAVDNVVDYWPRGMYNRHYHVIHDDVRRSRLTQQFDLVTCVSVLEHIFDHAAAVRGMFARLKPGGALLITAPYHEQHYVPNAYALPQSGYGQDNPYVCQVFSRQEINVWLEQNHGLLLQQEYWQFFTGEFWTCGEKVLPPRRVAREESHHLTCLLIRKDVPGDLK